MEAIRRLYVDARLVHGDLSEYNILIAPVFQLENPIESEGDTANDLQIVLIDFGQAVDIRHPESMNLLRRDLDRVKTFFARQGVKTLKIEEAIQHVTKGRPEADDDDDDNNNNNNEEEERLPSVKEEPGIAMPQGVVEIPVD